MPLKPGSTKPAVAWTISPSRPRLDLPSIRATTSSGISTYSLRAAERELAGVDHERLVALDHDLLGEVRRRVAQVDRRGAVVVEHAERVAQPQVDRRGLDERGVPGVDHDAALRDEAADRAVGEDGGGRGHARTLSLELARPRGDRPDARRRERRRVAVRAAARRARAAARCGCGRRSAPPSPSGSSSLGLLPDRPPDEPAEREQRHLERDEEEEHRPLHARGMLRLATVARAQAWGALGGLGGLRKFRGKVRGIPRCAGSSVRRKMLHMLHAPDDDLLVACGARRSLPHAW